MNRAIHDRSLGLREAFVVGGTTMGKKENKARIK
jgi:hypothetical protein